MQDYSCIIEIGRIDMDAVRDFFLKNEEFMLRLVENPMVFEHESFTDICIDHNIVAITDEIYEHILYEEERRIHRNASRYAGPDHHHRVG